MTVALVGHHPNPRVSPEKAAGVVGVSGDTIRRTYARDPKSVPYVYKAGRRIFVSIPLVHEHLHGLGTPWTDCPVCWQVGPDPYDDELAAAARENSSQSVPAPVHDATPTDNPPVRSDVAGIDRAGLGEGGDQ